MEENNISYGKVTKIKKYYGYIQTTDKLVSFDMEDAQSNIKIGDYVAFKEYDLGSIVVAKSIVIIKSQEKNGNDKNSDLLNTDK